MDDVTNTGLLWDKPLSAARSLSNLRPLYADPPTVTVEGTNFGFVDSSVGARLGVTASQNTFWISNTALSCQLGLFFVPA